MIELDDEPGAHELTGVADDIGDIVVREHGRHRQGDDEDQGRDDGSPRTSRKRWHGRRLAPLRHQGNDLAALDRADEPDCEAGRRYPRDGADHDHVQGALRGLESIRDEP